MEFNEAQKKALAHKEGPMMVLAGPGSGKTTVITHRILELIRSGVNPSGILVITFTRAAAGEMEERFNALAAGEDRQGMQSGRVSFGTFHSVFYQILKTAYNFPSGNVLGEEDKKRFLRNYLAKSSIPFDDDGEFISGIVSEISYIKENRIDIKYYYSQKCPEEVFRQIYNAYESELARTGKIDFDDMLLMCYELFAERKDILAAWQKKYRYILVDEFQDINRIQYEIIRMLALPENNLFIVGDDDQSIYRFRGSKPEIMLGFENDYPGCKTVLLGTNYRSTKEIVEVSLKLIENNTKRFSKDLVPYRGNGRPADLCICADPPAEDETLARNIRQYHEAGYGWDTIAVLFRTGQDLGLLTEKLMEFNIPFVMRDSIPSIYSHRIAKDIFAYMELAAGSMRRSDFLRIINRPNRYISRDAFDSATVSWDGLFEFYSGKDRMIERLEDLREDISYLSGLKPKAAVRYIRREIGYDAYLKEYADYRSMDAEELYGIADELSESAAGFDSFREWKEYIAEYEEELKLRARNKPDKNGAPSGEGVTLSTMHSAKGLEWETVFIIDANEGSIPHRKASAQDDIEEERRLFYVAMTRAKDRLHILAVRERHHRKQELSRFVKECMG